MRRPARRTMDPIELDGPARPRFPVIGVPLVGAVEQLIDFVTEPGT